MAWRLGVWPSQPRWSIAVVAAPQRVLTLAAPLVTPVVLPRTTDLDDEAKNGDEQPPLTQPDHREEPRDGNRKASQHQHRRNRGAQRTTHGARLPRCWSATQSSHPLGASMPTAHGPTGYRTARRTGAVGSLTTSARVALRGRPEGPLRATPPTGLRARPRSAPSFHDQNGHDDRDEHNDADDDGDGVRGGARTSVTARQNLALGHDQAGHAPDSRSALASRQQETLDRGTVRSRVALRGRLERRDRGLVRLLPSRPNRQKPACGRTRVCGRRHGGCRATLSCRVARETMAAWLGDGM